MQRIEQGFFFSKKYFYFEVWYPKRAVLATYTEEKANEWVTYIYKAAVYCRFVEQLNKETMESEPTKEQQTTLEIVEKEREKPNETLQLIDKEIPERSKVIPISFLQKYLNKMSRQTSLLPIPLPIMLVLKTHATLVHRQRSRQV